MSVSIQDITTHEFADAVVARSKEVPVVVDFWADWCGPCKILGPILEKAAVEANGEWELVKVDVDTNQELAMQFGVQGIPTVLGFRDGQPVSRFTGALPEASVREWLQQLIPSEADRLAKEGIAARDAGEDATAESAFLSALALEPGHQTAGVELSRLLIDTHRPQEALEILARLSPTDAVTKLQSTARTNLGAGDVGDLEARLEASPDDHGTRLAYGRALAAAGRATVGLEELLSVVVEAESDTAEEARRAMVDLFETIDDPEVVGEYRRRLANSLF